MSLIRNAERPIGVCNVVVSWLRRLQCAVSQVCDAKKLTPVCNFAHIAEKPMSRMYYRQYSRQLKKKINMKAEISESFKHKLDLNAGSKSGSFLTVNTTRLNYNNHPR
jgi:hypothetical protein